MIDGHDSRLLAAQGGASRAGSVIIWHSLCLRLALLNHKSIAMIYLGQVQLMASRGRITVRCDLQLHVQLRLLLYMLDGLLSALLVSELGRGTLGTQHLSLRVVQLGCLGLHVR